MQRGYEYVSMTPAEMGGDSARIEIDAPGVNVSTTKTVTGITDVALVSPKLLTKNGERWMSDPSQETLEQIRASIVALEQRITSLEYHWHEDRQSAAPQQTVAQPTTPEPVAEQPPVLSPPQEVVPGYSAVPPQFTTANQPPSPQPAPQPTPQPSPQPTPQPIQSTGKPAQTVTIEDLLSPRRLAWLGGAVLVAGIAFLVSIGIQDGWITPTMQLIAALAVCTGLSWGGHWLYEQRDQGTVAMAMFGAGIAGYYATLLIATQTYDFIDPLWIGLMFAATVAAAGTAVALTWDSEGMAALALLGAVSAPLLLDMSDDLGAVYFVLIAYAAIAIVCALQDWRKLSIAAVFFVLVSGGFAYGEPGTAVTISTSMLFWALTIISFYGSTVLELRKPPAEGEFDFVAAVFFSGVTSLIALLIGVWISDDWPLWQASEPDTQIAVWLIGFAVVNFMLALAARATGERMRELEVNALAAGFVLLTVGLGYAFSGPTLVIAFAVEAIVIAYRFQDRDKPWTNWAPAPLIALCVIHILDQEVPVELLEKGAGQIATAQLQDGVTAIAATIVAALSWAWFARGDARSTAFLVADAVAIYLLLLLLDGVGLVTALCALTAATAYFGRGRGNVLALAVPAMSFGSAVLHVLLHEAELGTALSAGVDDPLVAILALVMLAAVAGFWASLVDEREVRLTLTGIGLLSLLFAGSVGIVSVFQPSAADFATGETEFGARQQGQALLSGFWAIAALGAIVYGLLRSVKEIRYAGLGLLGIAVVKIVLFDLTSLDVAYRTGSFIAVGAMLLLAAFAYQNLKERVVAEPESVEQS